ncbi:MAG: hypothetical protein M3176_01045 [Chloroflexota bacterium]|nr:hypothetical protein [Chloroflexota bacterium]MDQ6905390.1 hypothetical protein [Chloroflexota bacterium]
MFLSHLTQSSKRKLAGGLLATTLALTGGVAVVGAANGTASPPAKTTTSRCADMTNRLASNLGIDVAKLQTAEKATLNQAIDARLAANTITSQQAQVAHDKVNSSADVCTLKDGTQTGKGAKTEKRGDATLRKDELLAVAKQLNISEQQLTQDLKGGKSLADEAAAHNVKLDDLKATLRATLKTDLDKAVADKKIDQAKEDKALAAFDKHADTLINRHHGTKTK